MSKRSFSIGEIQNPHATMPLKIPMVVVSNTSDDDLERNVRANAQWTLPWLTTVPAHDGVAILVGGGPSLADHLDEVRSLDRQPGARIFALNAACQYLRDHRIHAHYQVICDAKEETSTLVDIEAPRFFHNFRYLIASQVNPETLAAAMSEGDVALWHLGVDNLEQWLPEEKRANERGYVPKGAQSYTLIGGGAAVGNSATCVVYDMGYRIIHCFGMDSSHGEAGESHAYRQDINALMPLTRTSWAGKEYISSVAMKAQAEKFLITANQLKQAGCTIHVHGEGLLPAMWNTPPRDMAESDKYRFMWTLPQYREYSPGEVVAEDFLRIAALSDDYPTTIIDFGCGAGRASIVFARHGHHPILVDFADNCRDDEALDLDFVVWDVTAPCPLRAPYGFCADVMEHIQPELVEDTINSIMGSTRIAFFHISTVEAVFGRRYDIELHLTVRPHAWWRERFEALGYEVTFEAEDERSSSFLVVGRQ